MLLSTSAVAQVVTAFDDYFGAETFTGTKSISVLDNDIYPSGVSLFIVEYTNNTQMNSPPRVRNNEIEIFSPSIIGQDIIKYRICMGNTCDTANVYVGMYPFKNPRAIQDVFYVNSFTAKALPVTENDIRSSGIALYLLRQPDHGVAWVKDNKINYRPFNLSFTIDSLDYRICLGINCSSARVYIYSHQPNSRPVLSDIPVTLQEDESLTFSENTFQSAFNDPDGDQLYQVKLVSLPKNGILMLNNDTLTAVQELSVSELNDFIYIPYPDFNGSDYLYWNASDGQLEALSPAKVVFTVESVNDPPVAVDDTELSLLEDDILTVYPLLNDYDVDGDLLQIVSATAQNATIDVYDDHIIVKPATDFNGTLNINYRITDGEAFSEALIIIDIMPVNDPPVISDIFIETHEDTPYEFHLSDFLNVFSDPDGDQMGLIQFTSLPSHGELLFNNQPVSANEWLDVHTGSLAFHPLSDFHGSDNIDWNASDGELITVSSAKIYIEIESVNDPPVAVDDKELTMLEDDVLIVYPLLNDYDVDGDLLQIVSATSQNASAEVNDDHIIIKPAIDYNGTLTISYRITDGEAFSEALIIIDVMPVDDPPVISDIFIETNEDMPYEFHLSDFLNAFSDPDGDPLGLIQFANLPDNGELLFNNQRVSANEWIDIHKGKLKYYPDPDFNGTEAFQWQCMSGELTSNIALVNIKIHSVLETLIFYEGFSPNGDQKNDIWIIEGIHEYPDNHVKIFNRAGLLIFEISNYDNISKVWSGETNHYHFNSERLAPNDVYYYIVTLNDHKPVKGSVVLKR